ncbi:RsmD family RNA methyltransferase [Microbacterium sp. STN6]|uniref:RsmD family RNA methyltransferase n=1 Tax=Microbacterium sp. STN6 TaxID=2995588 RepID=UPI002260E2BE|nr:RsmD family RNA methyltransferase [Microbacterium sp. STN6]MCX7522094.1 RsmD family RNA methyltransferase [Microbacterium sp. STN6]
MTRIIAGFAGSLSLAVPPSGTRPTSDRVREAIFSALEARDSLAGATVFDLYAGSGALGLEAASRGAASVVLVERNAGAARVCRRNAEAVTRAARGGAAREGAARGGAAHPGTVPAIEVRVSPVLTWLESAGPRADVVFLDPPYDLGEAELTRTLAALDGRLTPGAIVLVERSSRSPEPTWPDCLAPDRSRAYGETVLWWAAAQPAAPSQPA